MNLLYAMSAVLLSWLAIGPAMVGYGLAIRRLAGDRQVSGDRVATDFWLGLVAICASLQITHFVLPVHPIVTGPLIIGGWLLLVVAGRDLVPWVASAVNRRPWLTLALGLMTLWMSNRAIGRCDYQDSGVYHTSAVQWNTSHPLVPGLANLNTSLAFNSSAWLYDAIFEAGPLRGRGNHGPSALLLLSLAILPLRGIAELIRLGCLPEERILMRARSIAMFEAVLLAPTIHFMLGPDTASFRTDIPSMGALFVAGTRLYRSLLDEEPRGRSRFSEFATIAVLGVGAVIFKLPAAVLAVLFSILAWWLWWSRTHDMTSRKLVRTLAVIGPCCLVGAVWAVRGAVISGYPAFPMPAISVDVPWKLPHYAVVAMNAWVKQWAWHETMTPPEAYNGWEWVVPWIRNFASWDPFKFVYPTMITIVIIVLIGAMRACGLWRDWPNGYGLFVVPIALSLIAWFFTAPAARWANVMAWLMLGWAAGGLLLGGRWASPARPTTIAGLTALFIALPPVGGRLVRVHQLFERGPIAIFEMLFFEPGPDDGFHPNPVINLTTFVTQSGLVLTAPVDDDRIFDAPLPSTPHPVANLRLREEGNLSAGFILEGGTWSPIKNWPNKGNTWYARWVERRQQAGRQ